MFILCSFFKQCIRFRMTQAKTLTTGNSRGTRTADDGTHSSVDCHILRGDNRKLLCRRGERAVSWFSRPSPATP